MADAGSGSRADGPVLVVVCGLPGVGKSTVAEAIAERVGGELLRTDVLRTELAPDPEYTDAEDRRVYGELLDRARRALERGRSAVLDGTFHDRAFREDARDLAAAEDADFRLVAVECPTSVVRERLAGREDDASDADFEVHLLFRDRFDPVVGEHVTIDNAGGREATLRRIDEHFPREGDGHGAETME